MSLLDDVSIVVTPNGYKAGELYAVIPVPTEGGEEVTGFTNGTTYPFDTFTTSGNNITSAIVSSDFAGAVSNAISVTSGEIYKVTFNYTKNSGDDLRIVFSSALTGAGTQISNNELISASGTYTKYFTITSTTTGYFQMGTGSGSDSLNASITNVSVKEYTSADMDVTRATAATRVDENGLVNYAEVLGGEEIEDGNFPLPNTEWTVDSEWNISSNKANYDNTGTGSIVQNITFDSSKEYKIKFSISGFTTSHRFDIYTGVSYIKTSTTDSETSYTIYFQGDGGTYIRFRGLSTESFSLSNVSVKEVTRDNVPRIDYTGGGCPHILAEPQRTNLLPYSSDFSQWITSSVTLTPNATTSPSGSVDSYLVDLSATTDSRLVNNVGVVASTEYTLSFYLKKHESDSNGTFPLAYYDGSNYIKTYVNLTDVWQRFDLTFTNPSGSTFGYGLSRKGTTSDETLTRCYAWGSQLEEGSYATSYIPTSGSTVTRNQDIFTRDGIGSLINSTEGVLFVEMAALSDDGTDRRITITDGTVSNAINIGLSRFSGNINAGIHSGGVLQTSGWGATGVTQTNNNKFALSWGSGAMKFYVNGSPTSSQTGITSPIGLNNLKFSQGNDTLNFYGKVKQLQVFKTTDIDLAALTS